MSVQYSRIDSTVPYDEGVNACVVQHVLCPERSVLAHFAWRAPSRHVAVGLFTIDALPLPWQPSCPLRRYLSCASNSRRAFPAWPRPHLRQPPSATGGSERRAVPPPVFFVGRGVALLLAVPRTGPDHHGKVEERRSGIALQLSSTTAHLSSKHVGRKRESQVAVDLFGAEIPDNFNDDDIDDLLLATGRGHAARRPLVGLAAGSLGTLTH